MSKVILGITDAVNTCDCCGKTNLKHTVAVEVDGEILYYGVVCATRHTGKTRGAIKAEIDAREVEQVNKARAEYRRTPEALAVEVKQNEAHKAGLSGLKFREFCKAAQDAAAAKQKEIAEKFNVAVYKLY